MDWLNSVFDIDDPRASNKSHPLGNVLFISIAAAISGFFSLREIIMFAEEKEDWLSQFVDVSKGLPSFKTFQRILAVIDPKQLLNCYLKMIEPLVSDCTSHVAIDGKTLRGSSDGAKKSLHIVNAWASEAGIILGQLSTEEKSNEITAIPELLKLIDCSGKVFSIDAMGCQREICKQIVESKGDYLIAVKGNQPTLFDDVKNQFENIPPSKTPEAYSTHRTETKAHGRTEIREYAFTEDIEWILDHHSWPGLKSVGVVTSIRTVAEKTSIESRFYLSSLSADAAFQGEIARRHWSVENELHWSLDVIFNEDHSRTRLKNSPENFSCLRKVALSLIKQHSLGKKGVKALIKRCSLNDKIRSEVLMGEAYAK